HQPIPSSFSFDTRNGEEPIHISAEKRYDLNHASTNLPVDDLSPILPTPQKISQKAGTFALRSGLVIIYDGPIRQEAEYLADLLGEVLLGTAVIASATDEDTADIYLRINSTRDNASSEGYRLQVSEHSVEIEAGSAAGIFYGIQSLKALIPSGYYRVPGNEIFIAQVEVDDAPRFDYRGQHIDVARNFQSVEMIRKLIRLMALYKLNKLHFHLTDDEGWRLEIPGLPELTQVGAVRGFSTVTGEMLPPAYGSGGTAGSAGLGSGFYTRAEYIDLLRYANRHHIEVIPEINGPGHARAAIKAMEARYERLMSEGKEAEARTYLLHDRSDTSRYVSAQNYNDNVICVCQENTYSFLEKVIAEVVSMYREADAPLSLIHTGGDEVPHGAWTGSPECHRLIRDEPELHSEEDLHPYFVQRYLDIASQYQLKIGGWEEITLTSTDDGHRPNPKFIGQGVVSYAWNAIVGSGGEDMAYQLANAGYEVVMCNASNLYFDLAYDYDPEEPGLFWAGYVDTRNAFELTPSNIFLSVFEDEEGNALDGLALSRERVALQPGAEENIIGIQGALWGEAIKNPSMLEYALLPKMLGLAERAWAPSPSWLGESTRGGLKSAIDSEWARFTNRLGKIELPRLDHHDDGYAYRISPPGAKMINGLLHVNHEYPGTVLKYTLDGSDPTSASTIYESPLKIEENTVVKIRAFSTNNRKSRITEIEVSPPILN
ncbi:MAG: family 20 glycosylhydrolase, partial [Saprospiraceae bacterium]|nr:family 20 glycosylhydrolase [Saprospiraceae bacterium]